MGIKKFGSTVDRDHPIYEDSVSLAAPAARNGPANTQADFEMIPDCSSVIALLTLTVGATGNALDLLDVYVSTYLHDTWLDVIHFTQIIGTDANLQYWAKIDKLVATAEFEIGTALGAAAVRNMLGSRWSARWTIFAGGGTNTWTFGVDICPVK